MAELENIISGAVAQAKGAGTFDSMDASDSSDGGEGGDVDTSSDDVVQTETSGAEETTETAEPEVVAEPEAEAAVTEEPKADAPEWLKELGPATDKKGKENRIPYSRTVKIVENQVAKQIAAKEAAWTAEKTEISGRVTEYEDRLSKIADVEEIMFGDQPRFLQMLLQIPGYQQAIEGLYEGGRKLPSNDPNSEEPQLQYGPDGKVDPASVKALMEWQASQTEKRVLDRMQPLTEAFEGQQQMEALKPVVQNELQEARTNWEGFDEHSDAILKLLQEDSANAAKTRGRHKLSLESAYFKVMRPIWKKQVEDAEKQYKLDKNKHRQEVLDELKKAPKATGVAVDSKKVDTDPAPTSIEDVIKQSLRKAKVA